MVALVAHVAHQARLSAKADDGRPVREHLDGRLRRLQATKGDTHPATEAAAAELAGPPAPAAVAYLSDWSDELYGRSGVSMDGFAPLTYSTVESWARLSGRDVQPHEVRALMTLDAIRSHPPTETDDG